MAQVFGKELSRQEVEARTGRLAQIAGIESFIFTDGKAAGVRGLRLRTGSGLDVTLVADRCLDIAEASFQGIPLCWRSPNPLAGPAFYEPAGEGWLRTFFGGLVTTCGLTNFGPPSNDQYGSVGQHGRINCVPAENVRWSETWDGDDCLFEVSGLMRETRVFGENLSLERRIWARLGESRLHLEDRVTNHGSARTPHMILYHCNAGFPLLDENACFYTSHTAVEPRDKDAAEGLERWDRFRSPTAGFTEQVFRHSPKPIEGDYAVAMIVNPNIGGGPLALKIAFDVRQLPAFQSWKMMGIGTYVLGMEPANCPDEGRSNAIAAGTLPFLEPGDSRRYTLTFEVLRDGEQIHAVEERCEEDGRTI